MHKSTKAKTQEPQKPMDRQATQVSTSSWSWGAPSSSTEGDVRPKKGRKVCRGQLPKSRMFFSHVFSCLRPCRAKDLDEEIGSFRCSPLSWSRGCEVLRHPIAQTWPPNPNTHHPSPAPASTAHTGCSEAAPPMVLAKLTPKICDRRVMCRSMDTKRLAVWFLGLGGRPGRPEPLKDWFKP